MNITGARTVSCGTPLITLHHFDSSPFITVLIFLSFKKFVIQSNIYRKPPHLANLSLVKFTFGDRVATDHRVHAWRFELKLGGPLAAARRTTRLSGDVRPLSKLIRTQSESPFSHFVCPVLCSASMGTNSGNLPPTRPLPAKQVVPVGVRTMVVAARMKVSERNGWKNGSYNFYIMSY